MMNFLNPNVNKFNTLCKNIQKLSSPVPSSSSGIRKEKIQFNCDDKTTVKNYYDYLKSGNIQIKDWEYEQCISSATIILETLVEMLENPKSIHCTEIDMCFNCLRMISYFFTDNSVRQILITDNDKLLKLLVDIFNIFIHKDKLLVMEIDSLFEITFLFWRMLRLGKSSKFKTEVVVNENSMKTTCTYEDIMKKGFAKMKSHKHIQLGIAFCLSQLITEDSALLCELRSVFLDYYRENDFKNNLFSSNDIELAVGKIYIHLDPEEIILDNLRKHFSIIKKEQSLFESAKFSKELHDRCMEIHKGISKLTQTSLKFYMEKEFIKLMQTMMETFEKCLNENKSWTKENRIMLNCLMTILSIICDMTAKRAVFIKEILNHSNFMCVLERIFRVLTTRSKPFSIEEQFLENVIFIFWNILKSRQNFKPDINFILEAIFNNLDNIVQIRIASALCLSHMDNLSEIVMKDVKLYLIDLFRSSKSETVHGFSVEEIGTGIAEIVTKEQNKVETHDLEEEISKKPIIDSPNENDSCGTILDSSFGTTPSTEETSFATYSEMWRNYLKDMGNIDTLKKMTIEDQLKLIENFQNLDEKIKMLLDVDPIFDILQFYLKELSEIDKHKGTEKEVKLSSFKTFFTIIRNLCESRKSFVNLLVNKPFLIMSLNSTFDKLVKIKYPSPIEKEILERILSIYWYMCKETLSIHVNVIKIIRECYFNSHNDDPIKIISALCIAVISDDANQYLDEVNNYLLELIRSHANNDNKIYDFSKSDIFIGLGHMASLKRIVSQASIERDNNQFRSLEKSMAQTSIDRLFGSSTKDSGLDSEKNDRMEDEVSRDISNSDISELITGGTSHSLKVYKEVLHSVVKYVRKYPDVHEIEKILEIRNYICAKELIKNSKPRINLSEHDNILKLCIKSRDNNVMLALLDNCETSRDNYEDLITIANIGIKSKDTCFVDLVSENIKKNQLTEEINRQILAIAFHYASVKDWDSFNTFFAVCSNPNDYLKFHDEEVATETFLTKMLKTFDLSRIKYVWERCKFDTNTRNRLRESPLLLAVKATENVSVLKWLVNVKSKDFLIEDWNVACSEAAKIKSSKQNLIYNILRDCVPKKY